MANYIRVARPGVMDRDQYSLLLDRSYDAIFSKKDNFAGELGQFFYVTQSEGGSTYKMSSVGATLPELPEQNEDTDDIPESSPIQGYVSTFTLKNYRQKVSITRTLVEMDRQGKAMSMLTGLVKSAMRKKEALRAAIFADAIAGSGVGLGADGVSLCNASHPLEAMEKGTWNNLVSGGLSYSNLQSALTKLDQMVNGAGFPDPAVAKKLLVSTTNRALAMKYLNATMNPENANNEPSVLINNLSLVVGHWLTDASDWFVFGDKTGEEMGLIEVELSPVSTDDCRPSDNPDIVWAKRIRWVNAFGVSTSRNIVGGNG